jgi:hypothetical protein
VHGQNIFRAMAAAEKRNNYQMEGEAIQNPIFGLKKMFLRPGVHL